MEDSESLHSHYWPGEGCIPITPQARRLGWVYDVYVTHAVWANCVTWSPSDNGKKNKSNPDKRIFELLESAWSGMGTALAGEPDRVAYTFKHWFWERARPKALKQRKAKYMARLLLDPETEEPWILIFDPTRDGEEVLNRGEHNEHREPDGETGGAGSSVQGDDSALDLREEAV